MAPSSELLEEEMNKTEPMVVQEHSDTDGGSLQVDQDLQGSYIDHGFSVDDFFAPPDTMISGKYKNKNMAGEMNSSTTKPQLVDLSPSSPGMIDPDVEEATGSPPSTPPRRELRRGPSWFSLSSKLSHGNLLDDCMLSFRGRWDLYYESVSVALNDHIKPSLERVLGPCLGGFLFGACTMPIFIIHVVLCLVLAIPLSPITAISLLRMSLADELEPGEGTWDFCVGGMGCLCKIPLLLLCHLLAAVAVVLMLPLTYVMAVRFLWGSGLQEKPK